MKIYIASSWKNQHGIEMLTNSLRNLNHEVISWVENNYGENHNHVTKKFDFETWVNTKESNQSFEFDTEGVLNCDLFIYYGPAGQDASAEAGIRWGYNQSILKPVPMVGLWAKGEGLGLMRKMFDEWFERFDQVIDYVDEHTKKIAS